ncbi:hypothetical protein TorRG33x02_130860 [Trema orientale]|uniref:Uncharacterized protein n=1 Tax=Trema orientale TaxID=63057 RepID=A0A2P5EZU9_TREOI|nr:hypothetical protein TorRG33x02_130860 [Trema orientale]
MEYRPTISLSLMLMIIISMSSLTQSHNFPSTGSTSSSINVTSMINGLIPRITVDVSGYFGCTIPPPRPGKPPLFPQLNGVNVYFSCNGDSCGHSNHHSVRSISVQKMWSNCQTPYCWLRPSSSRRFPSCRSSPTSHPQQYSAY